jgi:hypothetical protein
VLAGSVGMRPHWAGGGGDSLSASSWDRPFISFVWCAFVFRITATAKKDHTTPLRMVGHGVNETRSGSVRASPDILVCCDAIMAVWFCQYDNVCFEANPRQGKTDI